MSRVAPLRFRPRVTPRGRQVDGAARAAVRDACAGLEARFIPFACAEAAANVLTNPALDPIAKIAELKYCAVRVERAAEEITR